MIRRCDKGDFDEIYTVINDGAHAYKGVIPADCWAEPYMSRNELEHEIDAGVVFWGDGRNGELCGVMGLQPLADVTLIRHAYVLRSSQRCGVGTELLTHLRSLATTPVLVGTWADARWAIRFYEKHGFEVVERERKDPLLKRYWSVSERQREVSAVLADAAWRELNARAA